MGFKIRGTNEILEKLTNYISAKNDKVTDFNPGSAIRTLLESISLQLEEFYYDLKQGVQFAIKNSGYHAFGFVKYNATKSSGKVNIYFDESLRKEMIIPKGTEFHTGQNRTQRVYFLSTENIKVGVGAQIATIPVRCVSYGEVGNVQAGEINKLSVGYANVAYISNPEDFTNGKDQETETEREIRFREYVHTLQRGTAESVAYGIKQVPGVQGVYVDDRFIGFMNAYVHDAEGNLSEELKKEVMDAVDKYRAGGIEVEIKPIVKNFIDIDMDIRYRDGIDEEVYNPYIRELIRNYVYSLEASQNLNCSTLITTINDSFRDVVLTMNLKTKDTSIQKNELLRPRDIIINGKGEVNHEFS